MDSCHEAAVRLASRGLAVFPANRRKEPLVAHGFESATTDLATIDRWWWKWPTANVAVAVPAGILVVDVDVDLLAGVDGEATLRQLCAGHTALPDTLTVRSPRGGRHLWFRAVGPLIQRAGALGDGVDTRVGGKGYVLMPPSVTDRGAYSYDLEVPVAAAPDWLVDLLRPVERQVRHLTVISGGRGYGRTALEGEITRIVSAPIGTRNDSLNHAAFRLGQLVAGGVLDADRVARALLEAAGLGAAEAERTITSGLRSGMRTPRGVPA